MKDPVHTLNSSTGLHWKPIRNVSLLRSDTVWFAGMWSPTRTCLSALVYQNAKDLERGLTSLFIVVQITTAGLCRMSY